MLYGQIETAFNFRISALRFPSPLPIFKGNLAHQFSLGYFPFLVLTVERTSEFPLRVKESPDVQEMAIFPVSESESVAQGREGGGAALPGAEVWHTHHLGGKRRGRRSQERGCWDLSPVQEVNRRLGEKPHCLLANEHKKALRLGGSLGLWGRYRDLRRQEVMGSPSRTSQSFPQGPNASSQELLAGKESCSGGRGGDPVG